MNQEHQNYIDEAKDSIKHAAERTKDRFVDVKNTVVGDSTLDNKNNQHKSGKS